MFHDHFLTNFSRFFPFTILSFLYITFYEVYFYSLVSLIPRLRCYYRKQSRKISIFGDVQNIIIVSKINFRFLDHRQVEYMGGIQLILSLSIWLPGNTDTVPSLEIQIRHLMWTIKEAVSYSWKKKFWDQFRWSFQHFWACLLILVYSTNIYRAPGMFCLRRWILETYRKTNTIYLS